MESQEPSNWIEDNIIHKSQRIISVVNICCVSWVEGGRGGHELLSLSWVSVSLPPPPPPHSFACLLVQSHPYTHRNTHTQNIFSHTLESLGGRGAGRQRGGLFVFGGDGDFWGDKLCVQHVWSGHLTVTWYAVCCLTGKCQVCMCCMHGLDIWQTFNLCVQYAHKMPVYAWLDTCQFVCAVCMVRPAHVPTPVCCPIWWPCV